MPAWNDYKAQAKSRGALALELFIVDSTPAKDPEALKTVLTALFQGALIGQVVGQNRLQCLRALHRRRLDDV